MNAMAIRQSEIFSRLQPKGFIRRFLDKEIRPDGRLFQAWRPTLVTAGTITTANGSAMVRLGGTTVVCGIKAEVCEPNVERPNEGYFVPNVDLPALCAASFRPGPPPEQAQAMSETIHQLFTQSNFVPLDSLCIEQGKAVWVLYADIVCLNYDGNVLDASLLALVTALKNVTLPKAELNDKMVVEADPNHTYQPFQMDHFPISSSFCVMDDPTIVLTDPSQAEEALTKEAVTIVMSTSGECHRVYKNGGALVDPTKMSACFQIARQRTDEMKQLIHQATSASS